MKPRRGRKRAFAVQRAIWVANLLQINVSSRRRDIPTSFHQAQGKTAAGDGRTRVAAGSNRSRPIGQYITPENAASSLDAQAPGLWAERTRPAARQSSQVAIKRRVTGDIPPRRDIHISARGGADPT